MARSYANIVTAIWADDDFCARSAGAQRTYFMLLTQPDINAAGMLALTVRRWSFTLPEKERDQLGDWLDELAEHRFIVIDDDTEELVVRKFIKWDNSYTNPRRLPSIESSVKAIRSPTIRAVMATEIANLGLPEWLSIGNRDESEWHRVVVKERNHSRNLEPGTMNRESTAESGGPPSMFCPQHPNGTDEPCGPCGTAKLRYRAHIEQSLAADVAAKAERAAAIRDCERCNDQGWIEDDATGRPLARCGHERVDA